MTGPANPSSPPRPSRGLKLPRQVIRSLEALTPILAALVLLELAFQLLGVHSTFFPRPSALAQRALQLLGPDTDYLLLRNVRASLTHIGIGFAIAIALGVVMGLAMGLLRPMSFMLHPVVSFAMPLPMLAWAPIFLIVIGRGATTVTAITALAAFFPIVYNTVAGVKAVRKHHRWTLMSMGASRLQILTQVVVPGSLGYVITGTRLGLGFAWRALISSEMVAVPTASAT